MLCVSLVLALPSYAADAVLSLGMANPVCNSLESRPRVKLTSANVTTQSGRMAVNVTGIKLRSGADNPGLKGLEEHFKRVDCTSVIGFAGNSFPLLSNYDQLGTFTVERPWYDNDYFHVGNGLAMKVTAGDNNFKQLTVTQARPTITTYDKKDRFVTSLGLAIAANFKVIGEVKPVKLTGVKIGTLKYMISKGNEAQTVYAPITVDIEVAQADLRSCKLTTKDREFNLTPVKRQDVFIRGTEIPGGDITIGPVICEEGVDVKVNFFDHYNTEGLTDHLRTVYSDTLEPSQYALKIYPTTGGGQPLKFLPLSAFAEGRNTVVNETTVDFATNTVAGSSIQKNYRVNYVRLGTVGDDRPGKIKGIMTVEFLYY